MPRPATPPLLPLPNHHHHHHRLLLLLLLLPRCCHHLLHCSAARTAAVATTSSSSSSSLRSLIDVSISASGAVYPLPLNHHPVDIDACNSLIRSCSHSNAHLQSLLVFSSMLKSSIPPDLDTFPPLLKSIARLHLPPVGQSIHGCIVKSCPASDVVVSTALVSMYCSFGRVDDARLLFAEMPERNSVTWNALLTGYVHNRRFREAHELFSRMLRSGVALSEVTVVCALTACSHLGALSQGVWIRDYIRNHGLRLNVFVGTALIDMYMKCGVIDEALKVFRAMRVRNIFTWNALLSGYAMNGEGEAALKVFEEMTRERIKPDRVTCLALLCACSHQGFVEQGRELFIGMEKDFGLRRGIEHYGCMVDLLGRAGLLKEAHEVIESMPMRPDAAIWRAFVAACRIHGDVQLGELAVRKLLALEPENGENFILLANLLARDRRWTEVGKVRQMMRKMGIKKDTGCSSIEIDNVIHEFIASDQVQRDGLDEVFAMLGNMKNELKLAGYCVDTEMVSYDLEEEEKEMSMMHHSEKLALAFGMMRTQHGSELRVVKNLRMCVDCHTFFKFVSKVYERRIVVRDNNRFHHFGGGACSCKDYW